MKEAMVALLPQQGVESALGWTPEILQSRCHFGFGPQGDLAFMILPSRSA
jgi:hypothetical protein